MESVLSAKQTTFLAQMQYNRSISNMNNAIYMTGLMKLEKRQVPMPTPSSNQVVVKIEYVGICGSDSHYLEHGKIGDFVVQGDFILGHECAGTVVEIGEGVTTVKIGDKVCLEPGLTCGQCQFCKTGAYNLCPHVEFLATPPYHGCLQNYMAYPENMVFKLPQNVSTKAGALVEPFAVGIHACLQGNVTLGSSVAILGSGAIGLVTVLACKAFGASNITVVDIAEKRLQYAKKLGATTTINAKTADPVQEILKENSLGVDVVIEAAGSAITTQQSAHIVKPGGSIVLVGMAPESKIEYDFSKILAKEANITSVFRYRNVFPRAIEAIASGIANVEGIITHEFSFDETEKAFDAAIHQKSDVVKAVIKM